MQINLSKKAQAILGAALIAGAFSQPSMASEPHPYAHRQNMHKGHHHYASSDVTVRKSAPRVAVAAGPDAFHGPAALITAPVEMAGTIVSLPFRAVAAVFPAQSNDPRILIGAPVHFAGQIAEFPFFAVNSAFGVRPSYYNYN